jgi:polyferredoxin
MRWTTILRRISQLAFVAFVLVASVRHMLGMEAGFASVDALCPFGGIETLWTWLTTGTFVSKTHPSNLTLGLALVLGTVLAGNAFCGWICPFGAVEDALEWVRRKLRIPSLRIPIWADAILRYGRFVILAVILYYTISSLQLWFAEYDPYRTLFGLHWLFEPNLAEQWPGLVILAVVAGGSLVIERFWCKYLCPVGGVLSVLGHLSLFRIRRAEDRCKGCGLCDTPCPVGVPVATADPAVSVNCVGCLACVEVCPKEGALTVQLAPTWLDPLRQRLQRA